MGARHLVEADGYRGLVDQGTATARSSQRVRRAAYNGDWRDLNLSSSDRAMFTGGGTDDRETGRELASGFAQELGREVFDALLRRVP